MCSASSSSNQSARTAARKLSQQAAVERRSQCAHWEHHLSARGWTQTARGWTQTARHPSQACTGRMSFAW